MSLVVTPIFAFLGVFLLMGETAALTEASQDFPSGITRTFNGLIVIKRAYQTHGKGRSWNIQTMPIWSNIDITESDYNYMLDHRAPNDHGGDPDEITSDGYFCARVTLQQAGQALRVMHAGNYKLPQGSIGVCSALRGADPKLPVVETSATLSCSERLFRPDGWRERTSKTAAKYTALPPTRHPA